MLRPQRGRINAALVSQLSLDGSAAGRAAQGRHRAQGRDSCASSSPSGAGGTRMGAAAVIERGYRICNDFVGFNIRWKNEPMSFEHACFVSYVHPEAQGELAARFINDLSGALDSELSGWMRERCFVDRSGLRAGMLYNQALAGALCKSVCMIAVYTPHYFDLQHTYCAQEYLAMEMIEQKRLTRLAQQQGYQGLIIPVILRGEENLPSVIRSQRHCHSFERLTLCLRGIMRTRKFEEDINLLAKAISRCKDMLAPWSEELTCDCDSFVLPTIEEAKVWLSTIVRSAPDLPFRSGR